MESFIVRIYRREKSGDEKIAGLIDLVETGETRKFVGTDELCKVICGKPSAGRGTKRPAGQHKKKL